MNKGRGTHSFDNSWSLWERIYLEFNGRTPRKAREEGIECRARCLRVGEHDRLRDKATWQDLT